ncbi:hypothetical protein AB0D49_39425 [Streptomyces sp. NPDC048290]|uniref:hypothetical protein n=1 Tax=Streptomyces sp. NPDC048290 TaxID=3155811 RepID=UPI00343CE598
MTDRSKVTGSETKWIANWKVTNGVGPITGMDFWTGIPYTTDEIIIDSTSNAVSNTSRGVVSLSGNVNWTGVDKSGGELSRFIAQPIEILTPLIWGEGENDNFSIPSFYAGEKALLDLSTWLNGWAGEFRRIAGTVETEGSEWRGSAAGVFKELLNTWAEQFVVLDGFMKYPSDMSSALPPLATASKEALWGMWEAYEGWRYHPDGFAWPVKCLEWALRDAVGENPTIHPTTLVPTTKLGNPNDQSFWDSVETSAKAKWTSFLFDQVDVRIGPVIDRLGAAFDTAKSFFPSNPDFSVDFSVTATSLADEKKKLDEDYKKQIDDLKTDSDAAQQKLKEEYEAQQEKAKQGYEDSLGKTQEQQDQAKKEFEDSLGKTKEEQDQAKKEYEDSLAKLKEPPTTTAGPPTSGSADDPLKGITDTPTANPFSNITAGGPESGSQNPVTDIPTTSPFSGNGQNPVTDTPTTSPFAGAGQNPLTNLTTTGSPESGSSQNPLTGGTPPPLTNQILGPDGNPVLGEDGRPIQVPYGSSIGSTATPGGANSGSTKRPAAVDTPFTSPFTDSLTTVDPNGVTSGSGSGTGVGSGNSFGSGTGSSGSGLGDKPLLGPDGQPLKDSKGNPITVPDGSAFSDKGFVVGPDGDLIRDTSGRPITVPNGSSVGSDGTVLGPDGEPLLGADGKKITVPEGSKIGTGSPFSGGSSGSGGPNLPSFGSGGGGAPGSGISTGGVSSGIGPKAQQQLNSLVDPNAASQGANRQNTVVSGGSGQTGVNTPAINKLSTVGGTQVQSQQQMPYMPPLGGSPAGGQGDKGRQRSTWVSEDEETWGTDTEAVDGVIGR